MPGIPYDPGTADATGRLGHHGEPPAHGTISTQLPQQKAAMAVLAPSVVDDADDGADIDRGGSR
ncbi:hypothetical protein ACFVFI_16680 [Streptomyces sp. NPDC057705]|uniref:hypothetical protein n=1 Tax=Streptomyces sp. NPDC057705 TaxID=3346222 RepID=UPI00368098D0